MKTRIKELRLEKKLTQQTLAKRLGINQASLSKLECEASIPDAALLIDLARFFHVSTDYILFLSNERLNADHLLENNLHHLKKYQHLIVLFQKMNATQQEHCYKFLCSMMETNED
ncbi:MAG: helix-turn-helix domain-containing protein [Lachnospiraceae bacterium]